MIMLAIRRMFGISSSYIRHYSAKISPEAPISSGNPPIHPPSPPPRFSFYVFIPTVINKNLKILISICPTCGTTISVDSNIRETHKKTCLGRNGPAANVGGNRNRGQNRNNIGINAGNGIYAMRQRDENANN
ncbi:hypothetical protein ABFS83_03G080300 [Erythranthe nasuta]